jgi:hypothetical protein
MKERLTAVATPLRAVAAGLLSALALAYLNLPEAQAAIYVLKKPRPIPAWEMSLVLAPLASAAGYMYFLVKSNLPELLVGISLLYRVSESVTRWGFP